MSQPDVAQIYNVFVNTLKELELFADTRDVRLVFDQAGGVYIVGKGFCEQLQSNLKNPREMEDEVRGIVAKYCPRIPPSASVQTEN